MYEDMMKKNGNILEKIIKAKDHPELMDKIDNRTKRFMMGAALSMMTNNIESLGSQLRSNLEDLAKDLDL